MRCGIVGDLKLWLVVWKVNLRELLTSPDVEKEGLRQEVEQKNVAVAGYLCVVKKTTLSLETLHVGLRLKELVRHIFAQKGTVSHSGKPSIFELENF